MLKRLFSFATVALLALVVLAACGGGEDEPEDVTRIPVQGAPAFPTEGAETAQEPAASPTGGEAAAPALGGGQTAAGGVTVEAKNIQWVQKGLTIPANTPTPLSLVNADPTFHNFTIEGQNVMFDMPASQTVQAELNLPAGTYEYVCTVPGHELIMTGKLIVQ